MGIYKLNFGRIYFAVMPENIPYYINRLMESNISVCELAADGSVVRGNISWMDRRRFLKFNAENNCCILEEQKEGIIYLFERYSRRTGFYIGVIIAVMIVFFGSNTVLRFEVYGNESVSDEKIISALEENGIAIGKFIPSVDIRRCEQMTLTDLDELSWIGVRTSGCVVKVEVSEITEAPEMEALYTPCNIISAKDAQIIDIKNVYSGMLVPMLYDGVRKGDLLVSGTVKGQNGSDYYVRATGDIIGRYNETVTFFQPFADETTEYDDVISRKELYLFGLRIPLYILRETDVSYEYREELNNINIIGLKLPVGIVYSEYRPYTIKSVEYDTEQAKCLLEKKTENYEANFYSGEDLTVVDRKMRWKVYEDGAELTVTYTIEGNIGQTQEIMAKY